LFRNVFSEVFLAKFKEKFVKKIQIYRNLFLNFELRKVFFKIK